MKETIRIKNKNNRDLFRDLQINKKYKEEAKKYARDIINLNKQLLSEKNLVFFII